MKSLTVLTKHHLLPRLVGGIEGVKNKTYKVATKGGVLYRLFYVFQLL